MENLNLDYTNQDWLDVADFLMRSGAVGSYDNQIADFMGNYDRYRTNILPTNAEHSGLTFITRPRLNLQRSSLREDRCFAPLDGINSDAISFAIRAYLDTKFARETASDAVARSKYLDAKSPWFNPLMNGLTGISGWPDPVMQTTTTDPGFHSEDMTTALGHDDLSKTYDLSLTFKDIQGGPITAIFFYWLRNMHNLMKGRQIAYADDIDNQRLNYTVSIYRFTLDPSRRYITKYAKATGCFPKSLPLGAMFNYGESELFLDAAGKFTIPFVANKIEYMDYGIILDFNRLAERYWNNINISGLDFDRSIVPVKDANGKFITNEIKRSLNPFNNFRGRPYVDLSDGRMRLSFRGTLDEYSAARDEDNIENLFPLNPFPIDQDASLGPRVDASNIA